MRPVALVLLLLVPTVVNSQRRPPRPAYAAHVGVGGHQGWVGAAAEGYLVPGIVSGWVGAGVLPGFDAQPAWAIAFRLYSPRIASSHRLFGDVSRTLIAVSTDDIGLGASPKRSEYALGVMAGYSYVARSGASVTLGGGAARAADDELVPIVQLAVGWTWRR